MCFPQVFYPNIMIRHCHDWNESLVELRDHLQIQDKMRKKRKSNPTQKKKKKKQKHGPHAFRVLVNKNTCNRAMVSKVKN
jgi:hypothetical protein